MQDFPQQNGNAAPIIPTSALSRETLRAHAEEFATDPFGVFHAGGAEEFMRQWDSGVRFERGFKSLRGMVVRVAMDEGLSPGPEIDNLMDQIFLSQDESRS